MIKDHHKESELLKALAHPVRLRIVDGLVNQECSVNKIVSILKLPQSTVSQHLSVLKKQHIVSIRKEGVKTCYKVVDLKIQNLIKLLSK